MDKELISVIMGAYREKKEYLCLSIESILNQTYGNLQFVIILDDPNNIELCNIIRDYERRDKRITFKINQHNLGLPRTLNKALNYADGQYIARMDADDIAFPDRFENELAYMKKYELDITGGMLQRIDEKGNIVMKSSNSSYPPGCISRCLMYDNCLAHPTWLVKKKVYSTLLGYREIAYCEDYDFLLRAKSHGFSIGVCNRILLSYRINNQGISRSNSLKQMMSAKYLQLHYESIDKVKQEDIDVFLISKIKDNSQDNYEQALQLLTVAQSLLKKKKMKGGIVLLKSVFKSKYILNNLLMMIRVHNIRKEYTYEKI